MSHQAYYSTVSAALLVEQCFPTRVPQKIVGVIHDNLQNKIITILNHCKEFRMSLERSQAFFSCRLAGQE